MDHDAPGETKVGVSWILLTMGDRPEALAEAIGSIPDRGEPGTQIIVVANGAQVIAPPGVDLVELPENVGIPAGRNAGAARASGDILFFLDDDAVVVSPDLDSRVVALLDSQSDVAVVGFRIVEPGTRATARRHVPRLGGDSADTSGDVTSFLGGACAIRTSAFEGVGGLPEDFFYAMEETDLAWRLIDAGWRVYYDGDALVEHPATAPTRHGSAVRLTARNRVLCARRLLPVVVGLTYVSVWLVISGARTRAFGELWAGTREGMVHPVDRQPIRWRTVWRLTRLGRPPII